MSKDRHYTGLIHKAKNPAKGRNSGILSNSGAGQKNDKKPSGAHMGLLKRTVKQNGAKPVRSK